MNKLIEYFAKQTTVVSVITIFVLVAGIMSLRRIKREVFPAVSFDIITVSTVFPGAAADSVERLVTNPLELALQEVDGIKKLQSTSVENVSAIVLQLDPDQADAEKTKSDIQDVIDRVRTDLPDDAEDPTVTKIENTQLPVIKVALSGELPEMELRRIAKGLERQIESLPDVARVDYDAWRELEIHVEAKPSKLRQFDVTLNELVRAISGRNISVPGGILEAGSESKELIVRTVGDYETTDEVANTVVRSNSLAQPILVADVATVRQLLSRETNKILTNGRFSLMMTVIKKESGDAVSLVADVKKLLAEQREFIDPKVNWTFVDDQAFLVERRISVLASNFAAGLVLVLVILSLFLPLRTAFVAMVGIPFSFLCTFIVFHLFGVSLNLLSLMGLIIVLGMLVDDAIVVTENAQRYAELGLSRLEAAIKGTQEVWAPVAGSVLTTVAAFGPLMFMTGIFGKFVFSIPLGVVIALMFSLLECYFLLPNHFAFWTADEKKNWAWRVSPRRFVDFLWRHTAQPAYDIVVSWVIRFRYLAILILLGTLAGTGVLAKEKIGFVLFPSGFVDTFIIRAEAPVGTPLVDVEKLVTPISELALALPRDELKNIVVRVGSQFEGGFEGVRRGSHLAQINVNLTQQIERKRSAEEIMADLRKRVGEVEGINRLTFSLQRAGPPVGKAVSIGVRGEDYSSILAAVADLKVRLSELKGVTDVADSFIPGKEELQVKIKEAESAAARLTPRDIGLAVRAAYEGVEATKIRRLDEEVAVRVTLEPEYRRSAETLGKLELTNSTGNSIQLSKVAKISRHKGVAVYEHEQTLRQVLVTAEVQQGVTTSQQANAQLVPVVKELSVKHPAVKFSFGGEGQDTQESFATLGETFVLALLGVFLLLVVLFGNLLQPIAVVSVIPIGIMAVMWTFYAHGMPLSFLAMIGTIALSGVIVNNAIILIDFVNLERAGGADRFSSIRKAASTRLRPIFLTSATTVLGLLPTAYGIGGLDPFVVPIALALGWGVGIGSLVSVAFFPAVIAMFDDFIIVPRAIWRKLVGAS